jgi:hypothetical protein
MPDSHRRTWIGQHVEKSQKEKRRNVFKVIQMITANNKMTSLRVNHVYAITCRMTTDHTICIATHHFTMKNAEKKLIYKHE